MSSQQFLGVILAGGKGTRMGLLSGHLPKPLLPVANKPLIQHHIEMMKSVGIDEIVLLVGYKAFEIARVFGDGSKYGVRIRYVEQSQALGIAHAIAQLEPHVTRPFLVSLGDIYLERADLGAMLGQFEIQEQGAILAAKREDDLSAIKSNFSISLGVNGFVRRVVEKPRQPETHLKGVGLYLFDESIFDAIRITPRTAMRDEYEITHAIQLLIERGVTVGAVECVEHDFNISTARDLLRCNLRQLAGLPGGVLIGESVKVANGARIETTILGSGVTVSSPISVTNSVVLANCKIDSLADVDQSVVFPGHIIDCKHDRSAVVACE